MISYYLKGLVRRAPLIPKVISLSFSIDHVGLLTWLWALLKVNIATNHQMYLAAEALLKASLTLLLPW